MRLRKTYQGRLPDNKILNNVSNSATDTYSCKQINEMLIFEEEDPTVPEHVKNISEQDIKRWDEGTGGVVEESDPTVPAHVKAITQEDIDNWNNGTGGGGGLNRSIITISTNGTPTIANGDVLPLNKTVSVTGDKLTHDKENYQIVIGPGVTKVKLSFTINGRSSSRQWYALFRTRDGITGKISMDTIGKSGADQYTTLCVTDKILNVLEGDRYCIKSYNTGSAVLNADIGSNEGTYMTMEVVEPSDASSGGSTGGLSVDQVYPVGSVFISTVDQNPGNIFLGTSWERFATGRTLVGVDTSDEDFATTEQVGGEKTHLLTASQSGLPVHKHTQAAHSHNIGRDKDGGSGTNRYTVHGAGASGADATSPTSSATPAINNSTAQDATEAHNNLQPYITVFMWKRVA